MHVPSNPKRGWHDVKNGIKGVILFIGGGLVFVSGWILGFVLVTASDFLVRRNHPELWPAPPAAPPNATGNAHALDTSKESSG